MTLGVFDCFVHNQGDVSLVFALSFFRRYNMYYRSISGLTFRKMALYVHNRNALGLKTVLSCGHFLLPWECLFTSFLCRGWPFEILWYVPYLGILQNAQNLITICKGPFFRKQHIDTGLLQGSPPTLFEASVGGWRRPKGPGTWTAAKCEKLKCWFSKHIDLVFWVQVS